jgi:hyperosmotically inducible protein
LENAMTGRSVLAVVPVLAFAVPVVAGRSEAPDAWITTKAKIRLLTAEDVSVSAVGIETENGRVTLHGKVASEAEKQRAAVAVRTVDGVREVQNLLQVVPEERREAVEEKDAAIEDRVRSCLARDRSLEGAKVASVSNGVVLLSGELAAPEDELRAIETVRACPAVRRVASEIRTRRP